MIEMGSYLDLRANSSIKLSWPLKWPGLELPPTSIRLGKILHNFAQVPSWLDPTQRKYARS